MTAPKRTSRAMKLAPDIEHVDGWVLLTRDETDHETGERRGKWYIAWHEVFPAKRNALEFAAAHAWRPPFKAVRGSLSALAN